MVADSSEGPVLLPDPRQPAQRMKAITLWQPWATLIAIGAKQFETRSWATNYRGPLAIHAAKRKVDPDEWPPAIANALRKADYGWWGERLPYGCIVCVVNLVDVLYTEEAIKSSFFGPKERHFGDYTPGRFAWRLDNVQLVDNVPARGSQGFWEWDIADVVRAQGL